MVKLMTHLINSEILKNISLAFAKYAVGSVTLGAQMADRLIKLVTIPANHNVRYCC